MADQQILIGSTNPTATVTFTDQDGIPADPTLPVTVTITADDGTSILASTAATHNGTGIFDIVVPDAGAARLDILTLTWTAGTRTKTTTAEIVGGFYCSLAELRGLFPNTTKYPTSKLIDARQWFETTFERHVGRAFVARYRRVTLPADRSDRLVLPDYPIRRLRTFTVDDTAFTDDQVAALDVDSAGIVRRYPPTTGSLFPAARRITVAYEHGDELDVGISRACRVAVQAELLNDNIAASRELSVQTEIGLVRMSYPGPDRPFGIPFVDQVANDRKHGDSSSVGSVSIA